MKKEWRICIRTRAEQDPEFWHEDVIRDCSGDTISDFAVAEHMAKVRHGYGWADAPQEATLLPCFSYNMGNEI